MTPKQRNQRVIAGAITVVGILGIWAWSAARQGQQTERLSRGWVGEQWDVARRCLVGTPIGRRDGAEAIADALDRQLLATLLSFEQPGPPEPTPVWPETCLGALSTLHVEPTLLDGDPGDALARLEILAPRVIGDGRLDLAEARARARELAEPIAALDAAMPPGAEYDPADFPAPPFDGARTFACLDAAVPLAARPFLAEQDPRDALEDGDVSRRITEDDGAFTLVASGPNGTEIGELDARGRSPRFVRANGTLAWLDDPGRQLSVELGSYPLLGDAGPLEVARFAPCLVDGEARHLALAVGERVLWAAWPSLAEAPAPAVEVSPTPPELGTRMACGPERAAFAHFEEGAWHVVVCGEGACRSMDPLRAGGDLQLALGPAGVLAVARSTGTGLPLAWRATEDGWSEPALARRGVLRAEPNGFVIDTCAGDARSTDGIRWR